MSLGDGYAVEEDGCETVSVSFDILMAVTVKIVAIVCSLPTRSQILEHSNIQPYNLFAFTCCLFLRTR